MVVFVVGPLSKFSVDTERNYLKAEHALRQACHSVVSPRETGDAFLSSWRKAVKGSQAKLNNCDGIALVKGWNTSPYGLALKKLADSRGMPVVEFDDSDVYLPLRTA